MESPSHFKFMKNKVLIDAVHLDCTGLSPAHYGIYARIIIAMHRSGIMGQVSGTLDDLTKLTVCSQRELKEALKVFTDGYYFQVYEKAGFYRLVSGGVTKAHNLVLSRSIAGRKGGKEKHRARQAKAAPKAEPVKAEPVVEPVVEAVVFNKKGKPIDPVHKSATGKWFQVYLDLKKTTPTYKGVDAKALKELLEKIRSKMGEHGMEINQENTINSLEAFLRKAEKMKFIKDNYRLPVINQQFDVIYLHGKKARAGAAEADAGEIADAVSGLYPQRGSPDTNPQG